MSRVLSAKISQVRRKQSLVSAGEGLAMACAFVVIVLAIEMLADWGINWPWTHGAGMAWTVRAVLLVIGLAALSLIIITRIVSPILFAADDETLALAVERNEPDLRGRLIAAVQLSQPQAIAEGSSLSLVRTLIQQTEQLSAQRDFSQIVATDTLYKRGSAAALLLIVAGIAYIAMQPASATLLRRALLSTEAVPRQTRVEVLTGDVRIPRGDSITIIALAHGIHPTAGQLDVHDAASNYSFPLDADAKIAGKYSRKIDNINASFDYRVQLNDGEAGPFHVEAVDRPQAVSLECLQIFPAYIGYPDAPHLAGDLAIVAGSRLVVTVKANKPLKATTAAQFPFNRIHLTGSEKDFPLEINAADHSRATTTAVDGQRGIPLPPGTSGMSVFLVDEDGFETRDPTVYHIDLVPDKPPKIHITSGDAQSETITRNAVQHIDFDAADDFAISRIELRYSIDAGDPVRVNIPLNPPRPKSVSGHYDFDIGKLGLRATKGADDRISIQYVLYVEDLNTVTTPDHLPGHDQTDKYSLDVVTDEQKRQELMTKFANTSDQINSVTNDQQQGSSNLGQAIIRGTGEGATTRP
jgi:hypothetical protein